MLQADALARCCLCSDGDIRLCKLCLKVHDDKSADIEYYGTWTFHVCKTINQGAGGMVVPEVSNVIYHTVATALCEASVAFSPGESQSARTEAPCVACIDVVVGIHLVNAPVVGLVGGELACGERRRCHLAGQLQVTL